MTEREKGIVKWFDANKGYGFITSDQDVDIFVHYTAIAGAGYRALEEGQRVEFDVIEDDKGPQAQNVIII